MDQLNFKWREKCMKFIYPYPVFFLLFISESIITFSLFLPSFYLSHFSSPLPYNFTTSFLLITACIFMFDYIYKFLNVTCWSYILLLIACFHIWQTLNNKLVHLYTGSITSVPHICTLFSVVICKVWCLCRFFLIQLSLFIDIILFSSCLSSYIW